MDTLRIVTFVILFGLNFSYENLSRRKTTLLSQSSTYLNHNASFAKDGNLSSKEFHCAHTATSHSKAWLQVDFGEQFSINNVKIYYRREGNNKDDWKQYRFRQFYLDISDLPATQTITTQRTRCYTDHTVAPDLPSNIIDIPCKHTARYVIVETMYDAPEDIYTGAMLEICEIEVYGCPFNCMENVCEKTNVSCLHGCKDGYWNSSCDSMCDRNTRKCYKCNPGFMGDLCDQCDLKHYGRHCTLDCNPYCEEGCSRKTGYCYNCTEGRYGDSCNETCGAGCVSGCDQSHGTCTSCKPGWEGDRCDVKSTQNAENFIHQSLSFIIILPAVFSIGILLVIRYCWRKQCKRQIHQSEYTEENRGNQLNDSLESLDVIYENVRGEYEYQDLSPISKPSHYHQSYPYQNQTNESLELNDDSYENMRKVSEEQELDQDSEHSYFEPI